MKNKLFNILILKALKRSIQFEMSKGNIMNLEKTEEEVISEYLELSTEMTNLNQEKNNLKNR